MPGAQCDRGGDCSIQLSYGDLMRKYTKVLLVKLDSHGPRLASSIGRA